MLVYVYTYTNTFIPMIQRVSKLSTKVTPIPNDDDDDGDDEEDDDDDDNDDDDEENDDDDDNDGDDEEDDDGENDEVYNELQQRGYISSI
jgi:hypothetical protein